MVRAHALNATRAGHCKSGCGRQLTRLTHLSFASVAGARPATASPYVSAGSAVLFMKSELTVAPALPGSCRARRRPPAGRCCGRRSHFLTSRGRWRLGRSPFVPHWLAAVAAWRCSCCAALQQPRAAVLAAHLDGRHRTDQAACQGGRGAHERRLGGRRRASCGGPHCEIKKLSTCARVFSRCVPVCERSDIVCDTPCGALHEGMRGAAAALRFQNR